MASRQFHSIGIIISMLNNGSRIIRPVLALFLIFALCGFIQDERLLLSPDNRFSIVVPGSLIAPAEGRDLGESGMDGRLWMGKSSSARYLVAYMTLPEGAPPDLQSSQDRRYMEFFRKFYGSVHEKCRLVSARDVQLGKFPSTEFRSQVIHNSAPSPVFFVVRIAVTDGRIYMMGRIGPDDADSSDADHFFNSFKILKP